MDFAGVAESVTRFLDSRKARWALVGGVGLAAYGLARTTLDLDFATESGVQDALVTFLQAEGYETLHRSRGFSNHLHPDPRRGRLDFVYVGDDTADRLFGAARRLPGPGGLELIVAAPEHLAAMKVQALRDDPDRELQDLADIRFLLRLPGIDRAAVREYFARHGLLDRYESIAGERGPS